MAGYNGSGVYQRPFIWANDKANGINITASRFDTDGTDVATALSSVIVKDGQQTTTALIPFAVGLAVNQGSVTVPAISVIGDTSTGFYQTSGGNLLFTSEGVNTATLNTNGLDNTVIGAGTPLAGSFTTLSASSISSSGAINKVTLTQPATGSTITIVDGKTLKVDNTLEFAGTDSTVMTFPGTSDTVVTLGATQTLTNKTMTSPVLNTISSGSTATTQASNDSSTKIATTAFVNPASTQSTSGSLTTSSGVIFKWGTTSGIGSGVGSAITLGTAFPNNFFNVQITSQTGDTVATSNSIAVINSASQFTITNKQSNTATFYWFAIGN